MATLPTATSNNVPASPCVLTPPSGIVDGDRLFTFLMTDSTGGGVDPVLAGWSQITGSPVQLTVVDGGRCYIYTKVAASESGNYSWQDSGTTELTGICVCVHGTVGAVINQSSVSTVDSLQPLPASETSTAYGGNTDALATVLMAVFSDNHTSGVIAHAGPGGYSELADISDGTFYQQALYAKNSVAAGFDGVLTVTASGTGDIGYVAVSIAINEAGGSAAFTGPYRRQTAFGLFHHDDTRDGFRRTPSGILHRD